MEGIVRAPREIDVDRDQILHRRHFGRQDDAVAREPDLLGAFGGKERGLHHGLARHLARVARGGRAGVLVHQAGQQLLVERAPIGADAHRLAVLDRGLDDGAELPILFLLEADIAGVDAILVERFGAGRVLGQELVADIVKVADDRHADAHLEQPLLDARHGGCRLVAIDGDAHDLGARGRQRRHLPCRLLDVGGVGIGHGLHDDGRATTHEHAAHIHGHRPAALLRPGFGHVWAPLAQGSARLRPRRQRAGFPRTAKGHLRIVTLIGRVFPAAGSACRCR